MSRRIAGFDVAGSRPDRDVHPQSGRNGGADVSSEAPDGDLADWLGRHSPGDSTSLLDLVHALGSFGAVIEARAATLAARLLLGAHFKHGQTIRSAWPVSYNFETGVVFARRALDAAEAWLLCPCSVHARRAGEWLEAAGNGRLSAAETIGTWPLRLIVREAAVRASDPGVLRGHPEEALAPAPSELMDTKLDVLARWAAGEADTIDRRLWLAGAEYQMLRAPEMPPINWHCQGCGSFVVQTIDRFPDESEDSDCLDHPERNCVAGYSMNIEARCSICGQDLDWGDNLCKCFLPLRL